MYLCFKCKQSFTTISAISRHFKNVHNLNSNDFYVCVQEECHRKYQNLKSFQKHITNCHRSNFINSNLLNENVPTINTANEIIQIPEIQINNSPHAINNNVFSTTPETEIISDEIILNNLKNVALKFVCDLHSNPCLNRKIVEDIIKNVQITIFQQLNIAIKQKIEYVVSDNNVKCNLNSFIEESFKIFKPIETEYKFFKDITDKNIYISPEKITIDVEMVPKINRGLPILTEKATEIIWIPLKKSFKLFFELPNILKNTLDYQKQLESQSSDLLFSNFCQGSLWRDYSKLNIGKNVIPYFLYYDDFGVNNQLGSHGKSQSLAGFYIIFPSLPPQYHSKLENILLVYLFYSKILSSKGNHLCMEKLIAEINDLQDLGLDIDLKYQKQKIHFKMCLIIGDNVALNSLCDFVKSLSAFYTCRICKVHKNIMHSQINEDESLLRNRENYLKDVEESNVSATGVHKESVFNNILDFHIVDNASADIMHDFFETVAHYGVCKSLHEFIYIDKFFILEILVERQRLFEYGVNDCRNMAPSITKESIFKNKLKMTVSEMIIFLKYILMIIGDLVPHDHKIWEYLIKLVSIGDLLLLHKISCSQIEKLKILITDHHKLYQQYFNDHLRPTFHNLLHYPRIIYKVGPIRGIWSMRAEGNHRNFKLYANSTNSRKNLPFTLSIQSQLNFSNRILLQKGLYNEETLGKMYNLNLEDDKFSPYIEYISNQSFKITRYIKNFGKMIVPDMFLVDVAEENAFYKINYILVENNTNYIFFLVEEYRNVGFNINYQAYIIFNKGTHNYKMIKYKEMDYIYTNSHKIPNGEILIKL